MGFSCISLDTVTSELIISLFSFKTCRSSNYNNCNCNFLNNNRKEDLEKRLELLSVHYNESINKLKKELGTKVTQLIEQEKNNMTEIEEKNKLQETVEVQCAKLLEIELRYENLTKEMHEYEKELSK